MGIPAREVLRALRRLDTFDKLKLAGVAATVTLLFNSCVGCPPYQLGTVRDTEFTVKDKAVFTNDGESKYLVFTEEHGVFRNTDALWQSKVNSSDVQGEIELGKTYRAKVYGWRIPRLSEYPNILSVEEVASPAPF